jgi:hypothetical protein
MQRYMAETNSWQFSLSKAILCMAWCLVCLVFKNGCLNTTMDQAVYDRIKGEIFGNVSSGFRSIDINNIKILKEKGKLNALKRDLTEFCTTYIRQLEPPVENRIGRPASHPTEAEFEVSHTLQRIDTLL